MLIINTSPTIKVSWNHYTNTLLVKYKYIITGKFKAQATTTCWTVITVSQKYRWHIKVENEFQFLRDNNTGNLLDGSTFGKFFETFFLGGDKTFWIALYGNVYVFGDK